MKRFNNKKLGFTIVEVTLFLALSSLIMLGIILATNASVARQRYNDSVNDFADFLRGIYSSVMDVEHNNKGNGGTAVYGKFITFRQAPDYTNSDSIHVYTVRGKALTSANASDFGVDTLSIFKNSAFGLKYRDSDFTSSGVLEEYNHNIPWMAVLEKENPNPSNPSSALNCPEGGSGNGTNGDNCFVGSILIVRSPISGTVQTYTSKNRFNSNDSSPDGGTTYANPLVKYIAKGNLSATNLDFCLDSDDNSYGNRRNIRLLGGGVNSTAVVMVEMDDETGGSKCFGR